MKAIIAIDIGTSSARAGLVDEHLHLRSVGSRTYRLDTPRPGHAEQDPAAIFAAVSASVTDCLGRAPAGLEILGVCLDTVMHSFLAVDAQGTPLTKMWTWADVRAAGIVRDEFSDPAVAASLYRRTGCPPHPMYFPAKARWLQVNDPKTFARAAAFTSIKGYTLMRLTGRHVDERGIASTGGLLNIAGLDWDDEVLARAKLVRAQLPPLVEPDDIVGELTAEIASAWGIRPVPVVAGSSDGAFANVGAGCVDEGDMAITVGTSSAVRMFATAPKVDDQMRTWCYYLGDKTWVVGGAISAGASSLSWLADAFPGLVNTARGTHEQLDEMAARAPAGAGGLLFAPYLSGERNPGLQGDARGYLAGLSLAHRAEHFVRATMEGVSYQIAWVYQSVAEIAGRPRRVRLTGGFLGSRVWPQVLADMLGMPLEVPAEKEGSLIGAAAFGLAALDPGVDWRALVSEIPVQQVIEPQADNHWLYQRHLDAYKALYGAVRPHFTHLLSLQES